MKSGLLLFCFKASLPTRSVCVCVCVLLQPVCKVTHSVVFRLNPSLEEMNASPAPRGSEVGSVVIQNGTRPHSRASQRVLQRTCFVRLVSVCHSDGGGGFSLRSGGRRAAGRGGGVGFLQSDTTRQGGPQLTLLQAHGGGGGKKKKEKENRLGTKCTLCRKTSVPDVCFHGREEKFTQSVRSNVHLFVCL